MNNSIEKIAKILRTDEDNIRKIDKRLSAVTGKRNVMDKILEENETKINSHLNELGVSGNFYTKEVYSALISKVGADSKAFSEAMGNPIGGGRADFNEVLTMIKKVSGEHKGFFLKEEKAREFLINEPPRNVVKYLGYDSAASMLEKEDLFEVFSSLRFLEDSKWLNTIFFKQYGSLRPEDFEEREIVIKVLDEKWNKATEGFMKKKWHNISHLKEMGIIFVIPKVLGVPGELLRMVSLVFHYLNEISFYSELFEKSSRTPPTFAEDVISFLKGDVIDRKITEGDKSLWLVIQRYLAKEDENDWRLFVPHINPETFHWMRAQQRLAGIGDSLARFGNNLKFWENLDWVGDYFKNESGNEILISFDLVDTVMSLVKEKELIKYSYHHQEALWNKIFIEYFGRAQLEYFLKEYLLQGYFEI